MDHCTAVALVAYTCVAGVACPPGMRAYGLRECARIWPVVQHAIVVTRYAAIVPIHARLDWCAKLQLSILQPSDQAHKQDSTVVPLVQQCEEACQPAQPGSLRCREGVTAQRPAAAWRQVML